MVFSELTNNNTVTIYTKNEVNTYFVKQIESNYISTNVILEDYNYMITVPRDVSKRGQLRMYPHFMISL